MIYQSHRVQVFLDYGPILDRVDIEWKIEMRQMAWHSGQAAIADQIVACFRPEILHWPDLCSNAASCPPHSRCFPARGLGGQLLQGKSRVDHLTVRILLAVRQSRAFLLDPRGVIGGVKMARDEKFSFVW